MTWLSEIEGEIKAFYEDVQDIEPEYLSVRGEIMERAFSKMERMARVIRELVEMLLLHCRYADVVHAEYAEKVGEAFKNLSPDAKELLK